MREQLLEQVLSNPNIDDPRRVYADWLAEQGDPRGEFIAVQCELARSLDFKLAMREHELRRVHGAGWLAEMGLTRGVFRRGFIEELELPIGEVEDVKLDNVPLQRLVISGVTDRNVRKLSALPVVPSFGLRDAKLNDRALRGLAETAAFARAPKLCFHGGQIVDAAGLIGVRAEALHFDRVKTRNLEALAALPSLRELRIGDLNIDRILRSSALLRLTSLVIESRILPSTFVALGMLPELEHLEVPIGCFDLPTVGFAKLKRLVIRNFCAGPLLDSLRERWGDRLVTTASR